jgi:hypothetical protein
MFWSKSPSPPAAAAASPPPPPSDNTSSAAPSPSTNASPPPSPSSSREAQADAELAALLASLDAEHAANTRAAERNARVPAADDDKTGLPTDMNCLTAFDEMFYCYSFGGQFLNIYRYGGFRDCSEKSADWRFCMKTKVRGEVARRVS